MGGWRWCRRGIVLIGCVLGFLFTVGFLVAAISSAAGLISATSTSHTKLSAAVHANQSAAVVTLLKGGASPTDGLSYGPGGALAAGPPMFFAAQQSNPTMVKGLLEAGASPTNPLELCRGVLASATPITVALMNDDAETTKALLAAGAAMDKGLTVGPFGVVVTGSPLSALLGAPYILRDATDLMTMLELGADPSWGNTFGPGGMVSFSPLYAAAFAGNVAAVTMLLQAGVDPTRGITALGFSLRTPLEAAGDYWDEQQFMAKKFRTKNFNDIKSSLEKAIARRAAARSDL